MGWFKKMIDKTVDPFVPEWAKKLNDKFIPESVKGSDAAVFFTGPEYNNTSGGSGKPAAADIGNLTDEEAQTAAQKRLARIGRYFTSVLGDLSGASTGKQKVFS